MHTHKHNFLEAEILGQEFENLIIKRHCQIPPSKNYIYFHTLYVCQQ